MDDADDEVFDFDLSDTGTQPWFPLPSASSSSDATMTDAPAATAAAAAAPKVMNTTSKRTVSVPAPVTAAAAALQPVARSASQPAPRKRRKGVSGSAVQEEKKAQDAFRNVLDDSSDATDFLHQRITDIQTLFGITRVSMLSELANAMATQTLSSPPSSSEAAAESKQPAVQAPEYNPVRDLLDKEFEMTEEMALVDVARSAQVTEWYESRENNIALTKRLMATTNDNERSAIFMEMMSRCDDMPTFSISQLHRQLRQSGEFYVCIDPQKNYYAMRKFPACTNGVNCQCMKADIPRAPDTPAFEGCIGMAMLTPEEETKFWEGVFINPRRTCHLCQWVQRARLKQILRANTVALPNGVKGDVLRLAMRQPYTVKVECPDGFSEQCVLKPGEPALVGQNLTVPNQPAQYNELYANLSERVGSPRLPVPPRCRDPFPVAPFPLAFTRLLEWRYDRSSKQWHLDLSKCAWKPSVSTFTAVEPSTERKRDGSGKDRDDDDNMRDDNDGPKLRKSAPVAPASAAGTANKSTTTTTTKQRSSTEDNQCEKDAWDIRAEQTFTRRHATERVQRSWAKQCILSQPLQYLHRVSEYVHNTPVQISASCSYHMLLEWVLPMPTEFYDIHNAERLISEGAKHILGKNEVLAKMVPYDVLSAVMNRPVRTRFHERLFCHKQRWATADMLQGWTAFVRWCALVCLFRDLQAKQCDDYDLLESILYVLDGQWLGVLQFCHQAIDTPAPNDSYDAWRYTEGRCPFYSNPVIHFTEMPYPTFMHAAMTRHGESSSELEYLFNKAQPRAAMFRTLETKAPEAMLRRPFVSRYMRHVLSAAVLFGICGRMRTEDGMDEDDGTEEDATPTDVKKQSKRKRTQKDVLPTVIPKEGLTTQLVCRMLKHRGAKTHALLSDIAVRGMIYWWWFTDDFEPQTSDEYRHTVLEWTMETNQFALHCCMQAVMIFCCQTDIALSQSMNVVMNMRRFTRDLVTQLETIQAWLGVLWSIQHQLIVTGRSTVDASSAYKRCSTPELRALFDQQLSSACTDGTIKETITRVFADVRKYMSNTVRDRARVTCPRNSVVDILNDRFAANQHTMDNDRSITHLDAYDKLCITQDQMRCIMRAIAGCSALSDHDGLLARVMVDHLKWPVEKVALMFAIARKWHTVHPVEEGMERLYLQEPVMYTQARATAALIRRAQMFRSVLLPQAVAQQQLHAVRQRMKTMNPHMQNLDATLPVDGCTVWHCTVCQRVGSYVRPAFRESIEREMHPRFEAVTMIDCVVMCRKSDRLSSNYQSILPDRGSDSICTNVETGSFYCVGCETFDGKKCSDTPMQPLFLLGRLVSCGNGKWLTICPQPGCGVPSVVSMNTIWNEHGFGCSKCHLDKTRASQMLKEDIPLVCQLCSHKVNAGRMIEWKPYGYTVCDTHHTEFESILEFVDLAEREEADIQTLREAYAMLKRMRAEQTQITKTAKVLSDVF